MLSRLRVCLPALTCLFGLTAAAQNTINVPVDQPTIQAGINAANAGDTVLVAPNVYTENIDFMGKAITVTSSAGPATTIIDGGAQGAAVTFKTGELRSSTISGFTIRNGGSTDATSVAISAGIYVANAAPTISGNTITTSICTGIYVNAGAALIQGNDITSSVSSGASNCDAAKGAGGISIVGLAPGTGGLTNVVQKNTVENNTLNGAVQSAAGILVSQSEGALIQNNIIRNNSGGIAGGLWVNNTNTVAVVQNLIYNNTNGPAGISNPGGLFFNTSTAIEGPVTSIIADNTIANNSLGDPASSGPTQLAFQGNMIQTAMINNIIVGSSSTNPDVYILQNSGSIGQQVLVLDHNDFYNAQGPAFCSTCTNVIPQFGNIGADPKFANPASGDFHLQTGSPAIDAGNNSSPMLLPQDLDGNARVQDASSLGYPVVDMGVYEFSGLTDATPTVLTLTPSTYTPSQGTPVVLTANITSALGTTPTGMISFFEDGALLGSGTIDSTGTATFTVLTAAQLTAGVHTFNAQYPGQPNYPPSQSINLYIYFSTTGPTATNLRLVSSAPSSPFGQNVNFTATVTSTSGTPTGAVQFYATNTSTSAIISLGSMILDGTGNASVSNNTLPVGSYTITAVYTPTTSSTFSTSRAATPQTITALVSNASAVLTATPNPALLQQNVTITATLTATNGATTSPVGTVIFYDNGTAISSATPTQAINGTQSSASITTSTLTLGTHPLTAIFTAPDNTTATSNPISEQINNVSTSTAVTAAPNAAILQQQVTITATVTVPANSPTATGTVIFYDNGTAISGPITLSGISGTQAVATFNTSNLALGSHPLTAVYTPSSAVFVTSTSPQYNEVINNVSTTTAIAASPSPGFLLQQVNITATVTASTNTSTPTGAITFYDGPTAITGAIPLSATGATQAVATFSTSNLTLGSHPLTAVYAPSSAVFTASPSNTFNELINNIATTTAVAATPNPGFLQQQVTITATVAATAGTSSPTGTVTFYDGAAAISGAIPLPASGNTQTVATFTTSSLGLGGHSLTAVYASSSATFTSSPSNAFVEQINAISTTTAVAATPNPGLLQQQVNITATVTASAGSASPTGTVTFYDGATAISAAIPLQTTGGTQATANFSTSSLALGPNQLKAVYAPATAVYTSSPSNIFTEQINTVSTSVTLTAAPNPAAVQQTVTVIATVSAPAGTLTPQGSISITDNGTLLTSLPVQAAAGTTQASVTLSSGFALGNHTLLATYVPASATFTTSTSAPYTLSVVNADFSITASTNPISIETEHHQALTLTITSSGGFTAPVNISCGALPQYATCTFSNTTLPVPVNGSATTSLTIDTDAVPDFKSSLEKTGPHPSTIAERIALAMLFPLGLAGFTRRRKLGSLLLLAVFAIATLGLTACGDKYPGHTAPGSYNVLITATGTMPGTSITVTHPLNLTLTVTQ